VPDQPCTHSIPWLSPSVAGAYDALFGGLPDTEGPVAALAELAGGGPVLELGVGTGRVAIPLAARGIPVHGIDLSERMLEQLRAKPGGDRVSTSLGDFSEVPVDGEFALIYAATGTFFELPDQEAQVRCFRNVAARLAPGGRFALDGLIPDVVAAAEPVRVRETADGRPMLHLRRFSGATQQLVSEYVAFGTAGTEVVRVRFRYAWPGELDLMARLAGLELERRTAGWRGADFGAASKQHVSVYRRP
jgi:SAM-dependent methyltransferase